MPAALQASVGEYEFGDSNKSAVQASVGEYEFGDSNKAALQASIGELNSITALSPEVLRVWDAAKGQYVYAPRYVWNGTAWLAIGGTVPSWKHPFLYLGG